MHTDYSSDAISPMQKVIEAAILNNVEALAITDHFEVGDMYDVDGAYATYNVIKELYNDKIDLSYGVEIGDPYRDPVLAADVLDKIPFDFVLASCHYCDGPYWTRNFKTTNKDEFMQHYFDNLNLILDFGNFDCFAHLDLPKRYMSSVGVSLDILSEYPEQTEQVLMRAIAEGKGLEVNTSGLRPYTNGDMMGETMPNMNVIELYKKLGGTIVTVGSDSHNKNDVGKNCVDALDCLKKAGFDEVATFKGRKCKFETIEIEYE